MATLTINYLTVIPYSLSFVPKKRKRVIVAYASGLKTVSQNQLLPTSGTVIVRTRATLARLIQVQKVSKAAWPLLGVIMPSNLQLRRNKTHVILDL